MFLELLTHRSQQQGRGKGSDVCRSSSKGGAHSLSTWNIVAIVTGSVLAMLLAGDRGSAFETCQPDDLYHYNGSMLNVAILHQQAPFT